MAVSHVELFWCYLNRPGWWLGVALCVIGGSLAGGARYLQGLPRERDLPDGVRTVGQVVHKGERTEWPETDHGAKPRVIYSLRYEFRDAEGQERQGTAEVPPAAWQRYQAGDAIGVRYPVGNPELNRADDVLVNPPAPGWAAATLAGAVLGAAGSGLGLLCLSRAWRRTRVVCGGVPSVGRVTEVVPDDAPGSRLRVGYRFTDDRGVGRDGRTSPLPRPVASRWRPGDPILVLFRPDDVFRHEVDVYGARDDELAALASGSQAKEV
jgi:hypothetical protein